MKNLLQQRTSWKLSAIVAVLLLTPHSSFAGNMKSMPANSTASSSSKAAPSRLRVDDLTDPLGIDHSAPRFSWILQDPTRGALQTAYQIQVSTKSGAKPDAKPDTWDSGRVTSAQSVGVTYQGPALAPSTRYYWRVLAWDKDGKQYPASQTAWFETGLMGQENWRAKWIGYQSWEEAAVRKADAIWITTPDGTELNNATGKEQHIAYRFPFSVDQKPQRALLYVTGQDVASAWVNGKQVATGAPLPPWKQLPWKKYVQIDVTSHLQNGDNQLAIETNHYLVNVSGMASQDTPAMSATLVIQHSDGSVDSFATAANTGWKTSIHPADGWQNSISQDASWKPVIPYVAVTGVMDSGPPGNPWPAESVKSLRTEFKLNKPVASARLYATALGAYQVFLNGKRIGDETLSPGWTDYRLRLKYQTYDVTSQLTQGGNALAALIAPGWYSTPLQWFQQPNIYGVAPPSLRAQLRIQHTDGTVEWITTDDTWKAAPSPILKSEIYDGETQDARLIQPGWNAASFKADRWQPVSINDAQVTQFVIDGQDFQPIRVDRTLTPKAMTEPQPGVYIFDMGQNFSGVERLSLQGPSGTEVKVRTGEILNADGTLYTDNLRTAKSTDHFILAGKGTEEFQPQFTFHGFRYLELTGLPSKPSLANVKGIVFHTDAPFTAQLSTGSSMINSLWKNILWGQRSNFVGVPTDCPQRDERLGWTADAQVFWRTATFNMDLAAFSRKFSGDVRGTQVGSGEGTDAAGDLFGIFAPGINTTSSQNAAGWSDAGVIIPWTSWIQNGDTSVLEQNWDAMTKYLAAIERTNPDYLWKKNAGIPFGDWLSPEGPTQFPLVATASWAYDVTLMQQMAHALGKSDEEQRYAALFAHIQDAFQQAFVHPDGFIDGADKGPSPFGQINNPDAQAKGGDTQTGYVLALHMNLVPDSMRASVAQKLVDKIQANHGLLGTGFLGTPYLLSVLTETGHGDLAYHLLLNTSYPSWGYLIDHGATTMWERWNGDQMKSDPSMNSYNHYAYGAVADWIYRYAAGIDTTPMDAGFHTIYLHPAFDSQLGSIDFTYPSQYGQIHSAWTIKGGIANWQLTIPPNTSGWLPLTDEEAKTYKLDGKPVSDNSLAKASTQNNQPGYLLPAGKYSFEVTGIR